jgi:putative hydrolase of the HAD superfamily
MELVPEIGAVLWDVYGTMFMSASGDIGTTAQSDQGDALQQSLKAVGLGSCRSGQEGVRHLHEVIGQHHQQLRAQGIDYPEVDIVEIWRDALRAWERQGTIVDKAISGVDLRRLAVEYESRANPVWPMPGLIKCLQELRNRGLRLGIVSNAQFFTLELFPALFGQSAQDLGFDPQLQYYSYQYHQAKPGEYLYSKARDALGQLGVRSEDIIYIGNDMLNDILPASELGFRTALFAGDARSLRLREDDQRVCGVTPDLVLTDLKQLGKCI